MRPILPCIIQGIIPKTLNICDRIMLKAGVVHEYQRYWCAIAKINPPVIEENTMEAARAVNTLQKHTNWWSLTSQGLLLNHRLSRQVYQFSPID